MPMTKLGHDKTYCQTYDPALGHPRPPPPASPPDVISFLNPAYHSPGFPSSSFTVSTYIPTKYIFLYLFLALYKAHCAVYNLWSPFHLMLYC